MIKITNVHYYSNKETDIEGLLAAIVDDSVGYGDGKLEAAEARVGALIKIVDCIFRQMPEATQVEIINAVSWRFKAELTTEEEK